MCQVSTEHRAQGTQDSNMQHIPWRQTWQKLLDDLPHPVQILLGQWVRVVSECMCVVVEMMVKWVRVGEHVGMYAVVGEGGGGDGEVGEGKWAGEHELVQWWVKVVREMERWTNMMVNRWEG